MVSLRNKRFQLNYCAKVGYSKKINKQKTKEEVVEGEKTLLFSPPTPLTFTPICCSPANFLNELAGKRLLLRLVMTVRFEKYFTRLGWANLYMLVFKSLLDYYP